MIFDYEADWAWAIQPHGLGANYFDLGFDTYRASQGLGLSVDIIRPDADLEGYKVIVGPELMHMSDGLKTALGDSGAIVVLGPRSGARDANMRIPVPLPPAMSDLDVLVSRLESLRPDMPIPPKLGGAIKRYRDVLEGGADVVEETEGGQPAVVSAERLIYVSGWLDPQTMLRVLRNACERAGIEIELMPEGLRRRRTGNEMFWFNYSTEAIKLCEQSFDPASVTRVVL